MTTTTPTNLIGAVATYRGTGHPYLLGYAVRVVAVVTRRYGDQKGSVIRSDDDLAAAGGVGADDIIEVQPWLSGERRFSFVASDVHLGDLHDFRKVP